MKTKFNRLRFIGFPALMIVPAMSTALGAVINTDATGNRTVTTAATAQTPSSPLEERTRRPQ